MTKKNAEILLEKLGIPISIKRSNLHLPAAFDNFDCHIDFETVSAYIVADKLIVKFAYVKNTTKNIDKQPGLYCWVAQDVKSIKDSLPDKIFLEMENLSKEQWDKLVTEIAKTVF